MPPNHEPTVELARRVVAGLSVEAEVNEIPVESAEDAAARRFLGSPSVRVNGRDAPGVIDTAVSYEKARARVRVRAERPPATTAPLAAVDKAGYSATMAVP